MKLLALFVLALSTSAVSVASADLSKLSVLYVGQPASQVRARQYLAFLRTNVAQVAAVERKSFKPEDAAQFDVVLLDWPQAGSATDLERERPCLFGKRTDWTKPTVLVGSAGLNLAVVWKVRGGMGCTCLFPFAYGLREHRIFREPFVVNTNAMVSRKTPSSFKSTLTNATVLMLPLVQGPSKQWQPGWCTYPDGFEQNPDIEVFCGGENEKMAAAAACWRQGNLLHFGFDQTPAELNEAGQRLLLNSIAYISHFTEDVPIAITPSPFAGPTALPRAYLDRRLRDKGDASEIDWIVAPSVVKALKGLKPDEIRAWYKENYGYFHPSADGKIEIDQQARSFGVPIDSIAFFDRAVSSLRQGGPDAKRAAVLLASYAPLDAPMKTDAAEWEAWLAANRPYLFFSDQGDYGWYVDPLAKKRGIASQQLRGPARASVPFPFPD